MHKKELLTLAQMETGETGKIIEVQGGLGLIRRLDALGIRPGKKTAEYLDKILTRLTFWGAVYVSVVCVLPMLLIGKFNVPFFFGGTALLIVVGVGIDTIQQIQSHLMSRNYEGLMKKAGGRRR